MRQIIQKGVVDHVPDPGWPNYSIAVDAQNAQRDCLFFLGVALKYRSEVSFL